MIFSFTAKRIVRKEGSPWLWGRGLVGIIAYFLIIHGRDSRLGVLAASVVPETLGIAWVGAILTCAGILFAIWARIHIGRYWSASVALKSDHQLIRTGPYARIRHPIYTGIIFAFAGSAVAVDSYAALVAVVAITIMFCIKARQEESLLAGQFGPAFDDHRRATGFLLPKLL